MLNNKGKIAETKNRKFLSSSIFPKSKNGQIAETITWMVATIIIVVTLIIFIFLSVSISKSKNLNPINFVSRVGSSFMSDDIGDINVLNTKTIFALSLNENNKEKINGWINEK